MSILLATARATIGEMHIRVGQAERFDSRPDVTALIHRPVLLATDETARRVAAEVMPVDNLPDEDDA